MDSDSDDSVGELGLKNLPLALRMKIAAMSSKLGSFAEGRGAQPPSSSAPPDPAQGKDDDPAHPRGAPVQANPTKLFALVDQSCDGDPDVSLAGFTRLSPFLSKCTSATRLPLQRPRVMSLWAALTAAAERDREGLLLVVPLAAPLATGWPHHLYLSVSAGREVAVAQATFFGRAAKAGCTFTRTPTREEAQQEGGGGLFAARAKARDAVWSALCRLADALPDLSPSPLLPRVRGLPGVDEGLDGPPVDTEVVAGAALLPPRHVGGSSGISVWGCHWTASERHNFLHSTYKRMAEEDDALLSAMPHGWLAAGLAQAAAERALVAAAAKAAAAKRKPSVLALRQARDADKVAESERRARALSSALAAAHEGGGGGGDHGGTAGAGVVEGPHVVAAASPSKSVPDASPAHSPPAHSPVLDGSPVHPQALGHGREGGASLAPHHVTQHRSSAQHVQFQARVGHDKAVKASTPTAVRAQPRVVPPPARVAHAQAPSAASSSHVTSTRDGSGRGSSRGVAAVQHSPVTPLRGEAARRSREVGGGTERGGVGGVASSGRGAPVAVRSPSDVAPPPMRHPAAGSVTPVVATLGAGRGAGGPRSAGRGAPTPPSTRRREADVAPPRAEPPRLPLPPGFLAVSPFPVLFPPAASRDEGLWHHGSAEQGEEGEGQQPPLLYSQGRGDTMSSVLTPSSRSNALHGRAPWGGANPRANPPPVVGDPLAGTYPGHHGLLYVPLFSTAGGEGRDGDSAPTAFMAVRVPLDGPGAAWLHPLLRPPPRPTS